MKKYKNLSGKDAGFIVDGRTLDFQNGQVVEGPDNFKENMQKVLDGIVPLESAPIIAPTIAPIAVMPLELSEKQLYDLTKEEQASRIKALGYTEKIPAKEKDRVELIKKLEGWG